MDSILVFIDGTICDERHRVNLAGTPYFNLVENILSDTPTHGSVECMTELSQKYKLIYIGARPNTLVDITSKWLNEAGFPDGQMGMIRPIITSYRNDTNYNRPKICQYSLVINVQ